MNPMKVVEFNFIVSKDPRKTPQYFPLLYGISQA